MPARGNTEDTETADKPKLDLMVMNPRQPRIQANGIRVGDEMDLVAARRQFQAQLRGDDAAASVRRVTGDTNLHRRSLAFRKYNEPHE
jgi:hypothetical protein